MHELEVAPHRKISEQRVETGRKISAQILSKFKDQVLAVFITGSMAKALERPYSNRQQLVCSSERLWSETILLVKARGVSIESSEINV
jgi:hypothetical protein